MKQKRAFEKIDRKIYLVFLIVIAIAIINAVISTYTIQKSQRITSDIVNNTNPSLDALAKMNLLVTRSRMLVTNWVYLPNSQSDKDSLKAINDIEYLELRGKLNGLMPYWSKTEHANTMKKIFEEYESLIDYQIKITRILNNFEAYQDPEKKFAAEDILEREIIPRSENITLQLKEIIRIQTSMALQKQDKMLYSFNSLMVLVLGIALLIIGSILFSAFVISRVIIVPILQVREVIMQMGRGELPVLNMKIPKNAVGEMFQALGFLIDGFRRTSSFVEEIGKGNFNVQYQPLSEKDIQGHALLTMRSQLQEAAEEEALRNWMSEALAHLNETMRSSRDDFNILLDKIIETIVGSLKVEQSAIFLLHNDDMNDLHIQLGAYYALNNKILNSRRYELKEGLIGEAIANNKSIFINEIYDSYFTIDTGLGESKSCSILIIPLATSGKVVGAIQVASLKPITEAQKELLEKMSEPIAASLFSVRANLITTQLLDESRKQADELAYQEQELRKINDELTKQSLLLQQSEIELKTQQEELKQVNKELEHKAVQLEDQNQTIEDARQSLAFKAEQLEQSNKYKSAFLANMSHELRTPLNSILILAQILADNKTKHLGEREVEHASIIHKSGSDLLMLINDILDLSKIEAGKVDLNYEEIKVTTITDEMHQLFGELANSKHLHLEIINELENDKFILIDKMRVEQVLKNLLSNAFKFSISGGKVILKIAYASPDCRFKSTTLLAAEKVICISVEDHGIGIAEDKQKLVFEAFQQADGSTSRKFGGTGLGLAISRELMLLMGGEIALESIEGSGTTLFMYLPNKPLSDFIKDHSIVDTVVYGSSIQSDKRLTAAPIERAVNSLLTKNDRTILIIEDDFIFARLLMNHCNKNHFKSIHAQHGEEGLVFAEKYMPEAILLDLKLPQMDGLTVLKKLKEDTKLKNIPVHIISSLDKKQEGLELGAQSFIIKPAGKSELEALFRKINSDINPGIRKLLYLGEKQEEMEKVLAILRKREQNLEMEIATSLSDCTARIKSGKFECLIIDNAENEYEAKVLFEEINSNEYLRNLPLVFCSENSDECLREVSNVMHITEELTKRTKSDSGEIPDQTTKNTNQSDNFSTPMNEYLQGRTVLLVDDDMRNIYSLTHILEKRGMVVIPAYDGNEAIEKLRQNAEIEIVLMDIMMPVKNGYEAMTDIRKNPQWLNLPVIAITAKAMQGDREKCIEAGATDYLTKPVEAELLISSIHKYLLK